MNRLGKYLLIVILAAIGAVLGFNRAPQLITIFVLSAGAVQVIRRKIADKDIKYAVMALFITTFVAQLFISLFLYSQTVDTKYYGFSFEGDDYVYGDFGMIVGNLWRKGIFPSINSLRYYTLVGEYIPIARYQLYNAFVFYLFGACGGQILLIINCFLHSAIVIPVYFICKNLGIKNRVILLILALFLFWPSIFYWSLFNLKESVTIFSVFVVLSLSAAPKSIKNIFMLAVSTALLFVLFYLKWYMVIFCAVMFFYFLYDFAKNYDFFNKHKKQILLALLVALIFLQIMTDYPIYPNLADRFPNVPQLFASLRDTSAAKFSNTEYFTNLITNEYLTTVLYYPLGVIATLFLPFIILPLGLFQAASNIETIIWWCLIPFLIRGIWIATKEKSLRIFPALFFFFYWISILALTQGNMGTLIRQKNLLYCTGFIFIGLAIDRIERRGEADKI